MEVLVVIFLILGVIWYFIQKSKPSLDLDVQTLNAVKLGLVNPQLEYSDIDMDSMTQFAQKAIDASKKNNPVIEAEQTLKAFDRFVAKKLSETYEIALAEYREYKSKDELLRQANHAANIAVLSNSSENNDIEIDSLKPVAEPNYEKYLYEAELLAGKLLAVLRDDAYLMRGSNLISSIQSDEISGSLVLRSDRLIWGWNAGKLGPDTKVSLNQDGAMQVVQTGSTTTSTARGTSSVREGIGGNWLQNNFVTSGVAETINTFSKMDNRSAQLVITDPGWQAVIVFGPQLINDARAFADALQVHLEANFKKPKSSKSVSGMPAEIALTGELAEKLTQLKKLFDEGVLTQSEFTKAKKKLLD